MKSPTIVATFLCFIATYLVGPGSVIAASQSQTDDAAEWGLVFVGLATLGAIFYQAVETARAARATKDAAQATQASAEAIKKQIGEMERQTEATKANANAALLSAKAANTNIDLFMSKERARVRVALKKLNLKAERSSDYSIEFTIKNSGLTTAFITETGAAAYFGPPEMVNAEDVLSAGMIPIHDLPGELAANEPFEATTVLYFEDEDELMLNEIKDGKLFVGVRGYIKYKDVFDRDRETNFQYTWKLLAMAGLTEAFDPFVGEWKRAGPPENNQET